MVGTLVAAFVKDPILRHLFPDEDTYRATPLSSSGTSSTSGCTGRRSGRSAGCVRRHLGAAR
ncbi:hypothetical protein NKG94_46540 [Micromonospora sp. M12]